ncbi:DUF2795 domain-containing protein [Microbacterium sp. NPDC090014]|uniref:DUF2795 domain-containing protein n=1 Tax=Microbacterium sp. NPDC090014 TaxID=3364205 RepID=UPI003817EFA7
MRTSSALDRFLRGMEYPATRDDLLREAARDGLGPDDRTALAQLSEQSFSAAWHIRYHLTRRALTEEFAPSASAGLVAV